MVLYLSVTLLALMMPTSDRITSMAPFTLLEHTADIGVWPEGENLAELFTAASEGLCCVLGIPDGRNMLTKQVSLHAANREELLVFMAAGVSVPAGVGTVLPSLL